MRQPKGFTIIAAIFIVLAVSLLAVITTTFMASESSFAAIHYSSLDAFFIAEGGFDFYGMQLMGDTDWSSPPATTPKNFSGGFFQVVTSNASKDSITVTVTGVVTAGATTHTRTTRADIVRSGGGLAAMTSQYAIYFGGGGVAGGGGTIIDNNVHIGGSILTDSNISLGMNVIVSGDAQSSGTVIGDQTGVSGTVETYANLPTDPPRIDTAPYDAEIAIAAVQPAGDVTFSSQTISGNYYINGNVILKNNITISGSAKIVCTGTLNVWNNSSIGSNLTIIAGGQITFGNNNVTIGQNCLWYSSIGIDMSNNSSFAGVTADLGTSFISPGNIIVGNHNTINGLIFTEGTLHVGNTDMISGNIVAGYIDNIGENTIINLNSSYVDITTVPGLTGGSDFPSLNQITRWDEIF